MTSRYFFHMAFLGTRYHGWQRQSNANSIQALIESALSEILKEPITIMGCGRTDTQVHASQFYFHADIDTQWDFDLRFRLNKVLPPDLAIFDILPVESTQHARFDAVLRQYDYFIHTYKDPFLNLVSTQVDNSPWQLDKMKQAVALLTRYNDYRAFCKSPEAYEHTRCQVAHANLYINESGNRLRFQIAADRFLGRMVRLLMGKLIKIGSGTLSVEEFEYYLIDKVTPTVWDPAYPQGLFLSKVNYPYLVQPVGTPVTTMPDNTSWQLV
ncbi:MAG: tRNA pseudouridine(38-40) synthase TruA [Cyclobacteriaceae bacterium]|nr:tRNA pseudouridine(38-40) synthase TruA [Cyclobacteriaceae bacterium]